MATCSEKGIAVSSTPVAVNNATADVGIFLMIGALRQAYVPQAALRAGMLLICIARDGHRDQWADENFLQVPGRVRPPWAMTPRARFSESWAWVELVA